MIIIKCMVYFNMSAFFAFYSLSWLKPQELMCTGATRCTFCADSVLNPIYRKREYIILTWTITATVDWASIACQVLPFLRWVLSAPFYRWRNKGSRKSSDIPTATQLVNGRKWCEVRSDPTCFKFGLFQLRLLWSKITDWV